MYYDTDIQRLYIREAMGHLSLKDPRSFAIWCKNNGVGILSDAGSKLKYVIKQEFEIAKSRDAIRYIQWKYGIREFPASVQAHLTIQSQVMSALNDINKTKSVYTPVGERERKFVEKVLTKNKREL